MFNRQVSSSTGGEVWGSGLYNAVARKEKEINKWKLANLGDESTHWKEGFKMNQLMLKAFLILKLENVTLFCYTL